jgi:hypothetical protein
MPVTIPGFGNPFFIVISGPGGTAGKISSSKDTIMQFSLQMVIRRIKWIR